MVADFWRHRKIEKISLIIFCSAVLTYGVGILVSRLFSNGESPRMLSYLTNRYQYIGQPFSAAFPLFTHTVFNSGSLFLILGYLAPFVFLPLLSPKWCIPALAVLAAGVLSTNFSQHGQLQQYPAAAIPFLFIAFMVVLTKIQQNRQIQSYLHKTKNRAYTYSVIFLVIISVLIISEGRITMVSFPDAHDAAINQVIALVPVNASVTAPINIFPNLCSRTDAYLDSGEGKIIALSAGIINGDWGFPSQNTEYVVIDNEDNLVTQHDLDILFKGYTIIADKDEVLLYRLNS